MEGIDVASKRRLRNHQRFRDDVLLMRLRFIQSIQTGE